LAKAAILSNFSLNILLDLKELIFPRGDSFGSFRIDEKKSVADVSQLFGLLTNVSS
jgi:hypothetical protein